MKQKIKASLEAFSKSIVQPLMYLGVAGTVLILGILLTNTAITEKLTFLQAAPFQLVGKLIYNTLMFLINNLSIIFCVGIAGAMAKKDKGHASLIGLMSFFIFLNANNITLDFYNKLAEPGALGLYGTGQTTVMGIQVLDTGVFGGILIGCLTGYLFNKFGGKQFKGYFSMFSGVRFPFLLMIPTVLGIGFALTFIWPVVQSGINSLAGMIADSGNFGLFIYGFLNKLLVPTGLHHLVYAPFQFTDVGGTLALGETVVAGAYPIRVAEMNMPGAFSASTYFNSYTFNNLFPYIGIGFAFIATAFKKNKEATKAILLPLMMTAVLSAITEPIDFLFVFAAPGLFLIHSVLSGISLVLLKVLSIPASTSGGIINIMISNLVLGVEKTNWPMLLLMGAIVSVVYYFLFTFLIRKFDMKTPGREPETAVETAAPAAVASSANASQSPEDIVSLINGLGGKENIDSLENCFTRLRVVVKDEALVKEDLINCVKNSGIKRNGKDLQIILGMQVAAVRGQVEDALEKM